MKDFWFTFLSGAAVATPIAFGLGLLGRHHFGNLLVRWAGGTLEHPAAHRGPNVTEIA